jgi:hypothetical protein
VALDDSQGLPYQEGNWAASFLVTSVGAEEDGLLALIAVSLSTIKSLPSAQESVIAGARKRRGVVTTCDNEVANSVFARNVGLPIPVSTSICKRVTAEAKTVQLYGSLA